MVTSKGGLRSPRTIHAAAVALLLLGTMAVSSQPAFAQQFIYVANAGEDTLSKIDINLNAEVARYRTWFGPAGQAGHISHPANPWAGAAPSRIAVDSAGNVYVLDRFFYNGFNPPPNPPFPATPLPPPHLPVLLKITPTGGVPGVDTSNSPVALPMKDTDGDDHIDTSEIQDKRIAWAVEVGDPGTATAVGDRGGLGRALCVDPAGNLWVGVYHTMKYYKVDSVTGATLGTAVSTGPNHRPYSCIVDAKGKLWSVDESHSLAEFDTTANQPVAKFHTHSGSNYSVSLQNACGADTRIYLPDHELGGTFIAYDPSQDLFGYGGSSNVVKFNSIAIGVDSQGNVISAEWLTGRVVKYNPSTNTVVWDTAVSPAGPTVKGTIAATDLRGLIIDAHDDVWAVHLKGNKLAKYSGFDGHLIPGTPVAVGDSPYSYSNVPPPACPCARIGDSQLTCGSAGIGTYSFMFSFTNQSPFLAPATGITLSSTQATTVTPSSFPFSNPVPPGGQATVSGTFTVANPKPGDQVCLDIRLNAGEGWCCPLQQVCFQLPECHDCAKLQAKFKCDKNGASYLELTVTNSGPATAQSVQVISTTPGVTVSPLTTVLTFPQGVPVQVPIHVSGATLGQIVNLAVNLHGPTNPRTGVYDWCCSSTVSIKVPKIFCWFDVKGEVFEDFNRNGVRDSGEGGIPGVNVTLAGERGAPRTAKTDSDGSYRFEEVETGTYRLVTQPPDGWLPTTPQSGVHTVTVGEASLGRFNFGLLRLRP